MSRAGFAAPPRHCLPGRAADCHEAARQHSLDEMLELMKRMRQDLSSMPTREELARVHIQLQSQVAGVAEQVAGVERHANPASVRRTLDEGLRAATPAIARETAEGTPGPSAQSRAADVNVMAASFAVARLHTSRACPF